MPTGPAGDRPRLSLQTLWVVLGVVCGLCPLACAKQVTVLVLTYESLLCVYVCPACLAFSVSSGNDTRYNHSLFCTRLVLPLLRFNFLSPLMSPHALCPSVTRCPYLPFPGSLSSVTYVPHGPVPSHRLVPRPWAVPQREGQPRCCHAPRGLTPQAPSTLLGLCLRPASC